MMRPPEFESERADCTIRAFVEVSGIPYSEVHQEFEKKGRKKGRRFVIETTRRKRRLKYARRKMNIKLLCKKFGLQCRQIARSGTANRIIKRYPVGNIYVVKKGHCFAIIDGQIQDGTSPNSRIENAWLVTR